MAYATVTLTGTYQTPDQTPHKGHVEIIPSERVIKDTTGDVILTGRVKVELDAQGAFTVELPATDDPTLNPSGFGYTIAAKLHSSHPPAASFSLPAALGATTVEDLTPVDPSTFAPTTTYAESSEVAALDSRVTTVEGDVAGKADSADLATVATTGNYTDLAGQPTIPTTAADVGALPDTTTPADIGAEPAGLTQTTQDTLAATYIRKPITLADLPTPAYAAHMGSALVFPEETMEAFTASTALGVHALEFDCHATADGALVVMHDPTIDRTTTGSGPITDQLASTWTALDIDAGSWLAPGYASDLHPPFASDVFTRFGNKVALLVEAKGNNTAGPLAELIQQHGLVDSCIVEAASLGNLAPATALGVQTMLITNTPDAAALLAAGVQWVTMDAAVVTDATVTNAIAAGLRVAVHNINRRYDRDRFLALGAELLMTDDPAYVMDKVNLSGDQWGAQVWLPGQIIGANGRGELVAPDRWGYKTPGTRTTLCGFMSPLTGTYTLEIEVHWDKLTPTNTRYASMHVCEPDDRPHYANDGGRGYADGYEIRWQQQGYVNILKTTRSPASSTNLAPGTVAMGTGASNGAVHVYTLAVSPTQVVLTRTDAGKGGTNTYTVTDTAFRGGYLHFGKFDADQDLEVSFKVRKIA